MSLTPTLRAGLLLALCLPACKRTHAEEPEPKISKPAALREPRDFKVVETVLDGKRAEKWEDYGWADRGKSGAGGEELIFAGRAGWILCRRDLPELKARYGGLTFRYRAPKDYGDFLKVYLANEGGDSFPQVVVRDVNRVEKDGWMEVWVSMDDLNPHDLPFDRIRWLAIKNVGKTPVKIDKIGLTAPDPNKKPGPKVVGPPKDVTLSVMCSAKSHRISPHIYGVASSARFDAPGELNPGSVRWGGNTSSRYNWEHGHAWNTGSDWFFRNIDNSITPNFKFEHFLDDVAQRRLVASVTVPMLGWVAKDTSSFSFPVSQFGQQQETDPDKPEAGNGLDKSGKKLNPGPPTRTSVPAPPEFIARWVRANREADQKRGFRTVRYYILDNEPMLWNETHRDVHPKAVTYDELLERTIAYGTAVRKADPEALIAGPAEWGWTAYFYSAADGEAGWRAKPDRRAHGDIPLLPWYLSKLREHEKKTGVKLLDVLDVHFYPQARGLGLDNNGKTDQATNALRLRSTRALWDPTYKDESWIDEEVKLIPRLKEWIAQNYPGLGISIGEYNWGAENHMSGGLALAEVLGRFGQQDITSAYYWRHPAKQSAAWWAFRAYRNYDGKGASFPEWSLPTKMGELTSVFAARDEAGKKVVLIALNLEPFKEAKARITLDGCAALTPLRAFTYAGGQDGLVERKPGAVANGALEETLPPYSINVIELTAGGK